MAEVQYNVWLDKGRFEDAERTYQEHLTRLRYGGSESASSGASHSHSATASDSTLLARLDTLEKENREIKKIANDLRDLVSQLNSRVSSLEKGSPATAARPAEQVVPTAKPSEKETEEDEEDDFELFDDNEEDEEERDRIKKERVEAYEKRKANKPVLIAKSNIILDVKPWDDETDMAKLEECVRSIEMDGLLWGNSKFVPLAYGIRKLQISCVVEDDKVSTDDLEDKICSFEDYIQSMDIAAFNKI